MLDRVAGDGSVEALVAERELADIGQAAEIRRPQLRIGFRRAVVDMWTQSRDRKNSSTQILRSCIGALAASGRNLLRLAIHDRKMRRHLVEAVPYRRVLGEEHESRYVPARSSSSRTGRTNPSRSA